MNAHSPLTVAQARLLKRHQRGLAHIARVLAEKAGRAPTEIMFVLAHSRSNMGRLAREQLGPRVVTGSDGIVVPGMTSELPSWIERLALAGAVVDCTRSEDGVPVIVIDEHGEMAVYRLSAVSGYRTVAH